MDIVEFHVCQHGDDMHWVVTLDDTTYGDYLGKEEALLDAVEAARDVCQAGREARVFLRELKEDARIF